MLLKLIKQILSKIGTVAIYADLWSPSSKELLNPFINEMKIKASIKNMEKGNYKIMTIEELKGVLES